MKRTIYMLTALIVMLAVAAPVLSQRGNPSRGRSGPMGQRFQGNQTALVNALPYEELSSDEVEAISWMREEEKLARDVYLALYQKWNLRIFWNIAASEQRHMDAIGTLMPSVL